MDIASLVSPGGGLASGLLGRSTARRRRELKGASARPGRPIGADFTDGAGRVQMLGPNSGDAHVKDPNTPSCASSLRRFGAPCHVGRLPLHTSTRATCGP